MKTNKNQVVRRNGEQGQVLVAVLILMAILIIGGLIVMNGVGVDVKLPSMSGQTCYDMLNAAGEVVQTVCQ